MKGLITVKHLSEGGIRSFFLFYQFITEQNTEAVKLHANRGFRITAINCKYLCTQKNAVGTQRNRFYVT